MGSSCSKWQQPPSSQTEVLADPNMVLKILRKGASTELRLAPRIFMMELCDARLGSTARHSRAELWACLRQAVTQLFGDGQHREATEILVDHIMLVSPGASKEKMLEGRTFGLAIWGSKLADWDLGYCMISQLPESFGALVCSRHLHLNDNQLQSLPEGFGALTVGGGLYLNRNQLQSLPEGFGDLTVGRTLALNYNRLRSLPEGFGNLTVGGDLVLSDNRLRLPEGFGNITVGGFLDLRRNQLTEYPSSFPNVNDSCVIR